MTELCPGCRLPMQAVGRLVAARDDAGQHFVFRVCQRCTIRLERLPENLQRRQLTLAIGFLARHPENCAPPVFFDGPGEAALYCHLEAEKLSATMH